jgi:hypothetical protein
MPALACLVRRGVAFEVFARDDLFSLDGFDAWLWLKLRLFLNLAECSSFLIGLEITRGYVIAFGC